MSALVFEKSSGAITEHGLTYFIVNPNNDKAGDQGYLIFGELPGQQKG